MKTQAIVQFLRIKNIIMEKKNQKQIYHSHTKGSTISFLGNPKKTQKTHRKCLNHQKILTEGVNYPETYSSFSALAKERFSQSHHQKQAACQKVQTAANTMSSWSIQANSRLVRQMSSINRQMKVQNDRIKQFILQIQPSLDVRFSTYKSNGLNKVSLSQKIKNQSLMLRQIASPRLLK